MEAYLEIHQHLGPLVRQWWYQTWQIEILIHNIQKGIAVVCYSEIQDKRLVRFIRYHSIFSSTYFLLLISYINQTDLLQVCYTTQTH